VEVLASLRTTPGVSIVEETPRMILVETADDSAIRSIAASLPDWVVVEERFTPLPDVRQRILRKFNSEEGGD
jgi:hypothetical protein